MRLNVQRISARKGEGIMDIERTNGTKERRFYDSLTAMMQDAEIEVRNPKTKKLILYPKFKIPSRRNKRGKEKK